MKKLLCVLMISFAALGVAFADDAAVAEPEVTAADNTPTAAVAPKDAATADESNEAITFDAQKVKLAPQQKIGWPIALNILPGLGVGSFVQHDWVGGLVGLGFSAGAIGCGFFGYVYFVTGAFVAGLSNNENQELLYLGMGLFIGALAFETGNIVWGIIRPLKFRDKYNAEHNVAAAFKPSFTVVPVLAPNECGAVAVLRY